MQFRYAFQSKEFELLTNMLLQALSTVQPIKFHREINCMHVHSGPNFLANLHGTCDDLNAFLKHEMKNDGMMKGKEKRKRKEYLVICNDDGNQRWKIPFLNEFVKWLRYLYLPWLVGMRRLRTAIGDINIKLPHHINAINLYAWLKVCQRRLFNGWTIA